jgi:hypothetical protein
MRSAQPARAILTGDAENRFYEPAGELVEAAAALRRQAGNEVAVAACPSVLGCVEVALSELRLAVRTMEGSIGSQPLMRRGLDNLEVALDDAAAAAGAARALSSRVLRSGPHRSSGG